MTKILIIDDDAELRETLTYILEDEGYEIILSGDGIDGVEKFAREQPDLVITDIFMPRQEGIQTIREILAIDPGAKILAASGGFSSLSGVGIRSKEFYLRSAQQLGALDVIAKPFEIDDLVRRVEHCLAHDPPDCLPTARSA
jgi:DNA-binding response OmpR family regulator